MSESGGRTVLVCGVSGVGKTHLIQSSLCQLPGALSWRASEMIGDARETADPERLRTLSMDEIRYSQELLVEGFKIRRRAHPGDLVLLDAHSVIDSDHGLVEIPADIVAHLELSGIIHVSDDIDRIVERRLMDRKRVRPTRTRDHLDTYQARSLKVCQSYQDALGIPLVQIRSGAIVSFIKAIDEIIRT